MRRLPASIAKRMPGARWLVIGVPYLWMLLFFAIPFAIALKISFSQSLIAQPPYSGLTEWSTSGGVAFANVLDGGFGGLGSDASEVTLTQVSSTHDGVRLVPTSGAVQVMPGVPEGAYELRFKVCPKDATAGCSEALLDVRVGMLGGVWHGVKENLGLLEVPPHGQPRAAASSWVVADVVQLNAQMRNYLFLLRDDLYVDAYLSSLKISVIATFLCLLVGYPIAYAISRMSPASRNVALMLVILPSWTSFLIRIYAWVGILKNNGLLNNLLMNIGVIDEPLQILHTPVAVYIGIVYAYLPFMVLPLYANLVKHDHRLLEAANDLGAPPWKAFLTVTLPLSRAGIIAGAMLVGIPVVGEFVIPEMLGGADTLMIGRVLWQEFFNNRDWPVASAVAIVMLVLLIVPIMIFHRYQAREMEGKLT